MENHKKRHKKPTRLVGGYLFQLQSEDEKQATPYLTHPEIKEVFLCLL